MSNNVRVAARNIVSQRKKGPVHVDNSPRPAGLSNNENLDEAARIQQLSEYSVKKVPEFCQRCKKLPPYVECHNRVCAITLRRKYLCITCNQKAHQGIGDRDHKRNQIPQVVSPKIANVSSNKKYGKESPLELMPLQDIDLRQSIEKPSIPATSTTRYLVMVSSTKFRKKQGHHSNKCNW